MRKEVRERLRSASNAQLAQSMFIIDDDSNNNSIIHQLDDLISHDETYNGSINGHKNHITYGNVLESELQPKNSLKLYRKKTQNSLHGEELDNFSFQRVKAKIQNHGLHKQYSSHIFPRTPKQRLIWDKKSFYKEPQYIQISKEENSSFKQKYQINRSGVIKHKDFIYNLLLEQCQHCGSIKSEVFGSSTVCSNKICRLLHIFQNMQTFPIVSILFQGETPSSNQEQLEDLLKKIKDKIQKIEEQLETLQRLHYQIEIIIQGRKQYQKCNKNAIKDLISSINSLKTKKLKENQLQIGKNKKLLSAIQIKPLYEEFKRWKSINLDGLQQTKAIRELVEKFKPICLKTFNKDIAQEMALASENFNASSLHLNASEPITYNFMGNLNELVLRVDISIQLKRQNFLLIQKLGSLKLIFECRKTSRQLIELFNILPHSQLLIVNFDYKIHSHVSSETFPLLSKACQLAQQQLQIVLSNAKPQVFEDLMEASKIIKAKTKIKMHVSINSLIEEHEWPSNARSKQWGTRVIKNLLKNIGNKVVKFEVTLPLHINIEEISEYILNSDYSMLTSFTLKTLEEGNDEQKKLSNLLNKIVSKKRALLYLLVNQKKQAHHALNSNYKLAQSVYRVLF